ncbi:MAG: energy-coupling factor ABC transporter ATP-binding protein [Atopobiaceae bacterium]
MSQMEVRDLHFGYTPDVEVLHGVNLTFDERSCAIVGQNGAGKTTLVKLLKGLLRPTSGSVLLDGHDIADTSVADLARDVGLVFQNPNDQIFKNTVLDEVMFGPLQIGMAHDEAKEHAMDALERVGLSGSERTNPYDLGLSDRKMVSVAAILAMDTGVIILDEPTIAQDMHGKQVLEGLIKDLRREHKVVISILHDMDFVARTFDRMVVMAQGSVLMDATPRRAFAHTDVLNRAHLEQPTTTQLCHALGFDEVFLTPDEFVQRYRQLCPHRV